MNKTFLALMGTLLLVTAAWGDSPFDFRCRDVKDLVDLIEDGPDAVVQDLRDRQREFIYETLSDWKCSTDPFPPERNGRVYVLGVVCEATDKKRAVTDVDLASSGEIFKRNLNAFYSCFGSDLINETPKSYIRTSRGEGIVGILGNSYEGHHLIVEYGYFWDSKLHMPILWTTKVGYSAVANER